MLPKTLCFTLHQKQAAIFQHHLDFFAVFFVTEIEAPRCTQTYRGNRRVAHKRVFVIAVPTHAFVAFVVEVEQAGIVGFPGFFLHFFLDLAQGGRPRERDLGAVRIRVGVGKVPKPGRFPLRDDLSSEDDQFVLFPRHRSQQDF